MLLTRTLTWDSRSHSRGAHAHHRCDLPGAVRQLLPTGHPHAPATDSFRQLSPAQREWCLVLCHSRGSPVLGAWLEMGCSRRCPCALECDSQRIGNKAPVVPRGDGKHRRPQGGSAPRRHATGSIPYRHERGQGEDGLSWSLKLVAQRCERPRPLVPGDHSRVVEREGLEPSTSAL